MSFIDKYLVKLSAKKIGTDQYGNEYYFGKKKDYLGRNKRYVIYNGINETTKVPPIWHAWLHYTINDIPSDINKFPWQQEHAPNLSGTKYSYDCSQSKGKKVNLYKNWQPK